jgi:hypothetical protein
MKKEKWNTEDWQGRSKEQIENTYRFLHIVITIVGASFIGWAIYKAFTNIF